MKFSPIERFLESVTSAVGVYFIHLLTNENAPFETWQGQGSTTPGVLRTSHDCHRAVTQSCPCFPARMSAGLRRIWQLHSPPGLAPPPADRQHERPSLLTGPTPPSNYTSLLTQNSREAGGKGRTDRPSAVHLGDWSQLSQGPTSSSNPPAPLGQGSRKMLDNLQL